MFPKSVVCSLDALMSSDNYIMKVHYKQLVLFVCAISDVDQLNNLDSGVPDPCYHCLRIHNGPIAY